MREDYTEYNEYPKIEEDLGGEKPVDERRDGINDTQHQTDSKPPKPKCFMGDCAELYNKDDPCEDYEAQQGRWGKCHEYKDRLSKGMSKEPRENDEPLKKMIKIKNKQLKKHYSGKEEHLICLTCEAIVSKKIILEFIEKIDYIMERIEFHTENPDSELMDEVSEIYKEYEKKLK